MPILTYYPQAYLSKKRNLKTGLRSRTKILQTLELGEKTAREISETMKTSYACASHHLHLLRAENYVIRVGEKKPFKWRTTGLGQQKLTT
ncbi:MAG TPA: winged helix-turn-helix domain-containing protein [archaeon]|nr:winged helix-turn-helix domain-containing protein [archaeon]